MICKHLEKNRDMVRSLQYELGKPSKWGILYNLIYIKKQ